MKFQWLILHLYFIIKNHNSSATYLINWVTILSFLTASVTLLGYKQCKVVINEQSVLIKPGVVGIISLSLSSVKRNKK